MAQYGLGQIKQANTQVVTNCYLQWNSSHLQSFRDDSSLVYNRFLRAFIHRWNKMRGQHCTGSVCWASIMHMANEIGVWCINSFGIKLIQTKSSSRNDSVCVKSIHANIEFAFICELHLNDVNIFNWMKEKKKKTEKTNANKSDAVNEQSPTHGSQQHQAAFSSKQLRSVKNSHHQKANHLRRFQRNNHFYCIWMTQHSNFKMSNKHSIKWIGKVLPTTHFFTYTYLSGTYALRLFLECTVCAHCGR